MTLCLVLLGILVSFECDVFKTLLNDVCVNLSASEICTVTGGVATVPQKQMAEGKGKNSVIGDIHLLLYIWLLDDKQIKYCQKAYFFNYN